MRRALAEAAAAIGADFRNHAVAVLLTDDAAVRRLNAQWRGIDKPTNVLSFPAARASGARRRRSRSATSRSPTRPPRAKRRPRASRSPHHLAHLAVHGFLHLLGYDHELEAQAETMEQLERVILARLGVPDPYLTHAKSSQDARV